MSDLVGSVSTELARQPIPCQHPHFRLEWGSWWSLTRIRETQACLQTTNGDAEFECGPQTGLYRDIMMTDMVFPMEHSDIRRAGQIPFLEVHDGSFRLNPLAIKHVRSLPANISVCTIFGPPRTGKTTLFRQCLTRTNVIPQSEVVDNASDVHNTESQKFEHSDNVALWIWLDMIPIKRSDGSEISLLFLQSGLNQESWQDYASMVFALTVLLSSHVLYNGPQILDDSIISDLDTIRQLPKHVRTKWMSHEQEDCVKFREFFPKLTFVIRDCNEQDLLSCETDERLLSIRSREHLESKLAVSGFSDAAEKKNIIRKMIRSFFPGLHCFLFPRPNSAAQATFSTQLALLRKYIFTHAIVKDLIDIPMSGLLYSHLSEFYVNTLNQSGCLSIPGAWRDLNERRCRIALDKAIDGYCISFREICSHLPTTDSILQLKHFQQAERARSSFNQTSFECPRRLQEKFREVLEDHLICAFKSLSGRNYQLSRDAAVLVLDRLYDSIHSRAEEIQTLNEYEAHRIKLRQQFCMLTADVSEQACKTLLAEYLDQKLFQFTQELLSRSAGASRSPSRAGSHCSTAPTFSPPCSPRNLSISRNSFYDLDGPANLPFRSSTSRDLSKLLDEHTQFGLLEDDIFNRSRNFDQVSISSESESIRALWDAMGAVSREGEQDFHLIAPSRERAIVPDDTLSLHSSDTFNNHIIGQFPGLDECARSHARGSKPPCQRSLRKRSTGGFDLYGASANVVTFRENAAQNPDSNCARNHISNDCPPPEISLQKSYGRESWFKLERSQQEYNVILENKGDEDQDQRASQQSTTCGTFSGRSTLASEITGYTYHPSSIATDENHLGENSPYPGGRDKLTSVIDFESDTSTESEELLIRQNQCRKGIEVMREEMHNSLHSIDHRIKEEMHVSISNIRNEIDQLMGQLSGLLNHLKHVQQTSGEEKQKTSRIFIPERSEDDDTLNEQIKALNVEIGMRRRLIEQMTQKFNSSFSGDLVKSQESSGDSEVGDHHREIVCSLFLFDVSSIVESLTLEVHRLEPKRSDSQHVYCQKVMVIGMASGGAAERSGLIFPGDVLLDINGVDLCRQENPLQHVGNILASCGNDQDSLLTLTFERGEMQRFAISGPRSPQLLMQKAEPSSPKIPSATFFNMSSEGLFNAFGAFIPELRSFSF